MVMPDAAWNSKEMQVVRARHCAAQADNVRPENWPCSLARVHPFPASRQTLAVPTEGLEGASCEEASGSQRPQTSRRSRGRRAVRSLPELRARGATRNASALMGCMAQLVTAPRRISGHSNRWSPAAKWSTVPVLLSEQVHPGESPGHASCAVHASALLRGVGGGVEGGGDVLLGGRPEMPQTRPPACSFHPSLQMLLERRSPFVVARTLGTFAKTKQTMASRRAPCRCISRAR